MTSNVFADSGRKEGLEIWRIEDFTPIPQDPSERGKFHEGDSYLVLRTYELGSDFKWNIHFWIGRKTTTDESGAAAILAVELDDFLGGAPVQYREIQDHESQLFLSYFPSGVRYLPGGVKSGFAHVSPNEPDPNEPKKLYHVKGKRNVRVRQVRVGIESMNAGDCFILDDGNTIFVYHGRKSKSTEKLRAIVAADQIRDQDHAGRAEVKILDAFADEGELREFFDALGCSSGAAEVPSEDAGGSDEDFEVTSETRVSLYKVSDSSGELEIDKLAEKPLYRAMLNSDDCYILDTVSSGIFAWVGKGSTKKEREAVIRKAEDFLRQKNYPSWTRMTRVIEGGEPSTFKEYFSVWNEPETRSERFHKYATREQIAAVAKTDPESLNESRMRHLQKSGGAAFTFCPDNGDGAAEVYRIENFNPVPIGDDKFGMFFGGDSYVIKYTTTRNRHVIYYWLGRESSQDERAAAAIQAVIMDGELDGAATIVRVVHGFEPHHFNKIFQGRMIIFSGGRASGFKNIGDKDTYDTDGTRLFRIRGTCAEDVRAVQLPEKASSLNSDDVFLLETPGGNYLWFGKGSNEHERDMAKNLPMILSLGNPPAEIEEGAEPEDFFNALGGPGEYPREADDGPSTTPRLFHFTPGRPSEEIFDFRKKDLDSDDVFVLRFGEEVYLWIGRGTTEEERVAAKKRHQYEDCGVCFLIHEGSEPERFKAFFPDWEA